MSFDSYLIEKYSYTQENQYFRKLSDALKSTFEGVKGEHILIGNISVNGHFFDALFFSRGLVTVIDFKNYGGKLKFSENGPWLIETKGGGEVYVQGGAQMRNPYQQVRAYRFSLMEFLEDNQNEIFEGVRSNINWSHIGSIVLFQQKVSYDYDSIPGLIRPWFHIADNDTIQTLLLDKNSDNLNLTDAEIRNILTALNVSPEQLLERFSFTDDSPTRKQTNVSAEKIAFIKRLIDGNVQEPQSTRLLKYYRTLIQLERFKEPSAENLNYFPFNSNQDPERYSVDLSENRNFHEAWQRNKQELYPKNVFVGIELELNGKGKTLLYTVLLTSEIKNIQRLEINLNQFELYVKELEQMGLDEVVIDDLSTGINVANTLSAKVEVFQSILSESIKLGTRLIVGLSSESLFTAQLQSELSSLIKNNSVDLNAVFDSFLYQDNKLKNADPLTLDPFIQITPLNSSQTEAIQQAFKQDITVITGPPGTGKSQVVTNILANAALNNHSVLFASKNNKAVDNVKERLDALVGREAVLRFGSKSDLIDVTKPTLEKHLKKVGNGDYEDVSEQLATIKQSIKNLHSRKSTLEKLIEKISLLEGQLIEYDNAKVNSIDKRIEWENTVAINLKDLFVTQRLSFSVDPIELTLKLKTITKAKYGFFNKLFFDFFQKARVVDYVKRVNNQLPTAFKNYIEEGAPFVSLEQSLIQSLENNLLFILELHKEQNAILSKQKNFDAELIGIEEKLAKARTELETLIEQRPTYIKEINEITADLPKKGLNAFSLKLDDDLCKINRSSIQSFLDFIPAKVWKNEDILDFTLASGNFLKSFNIVCVTSLSIKNSFPLKEQLFDLVVIDEASQCDLVSALPMLFRAKKAVIIGDPLQLRHITSVQNYEEEYVLEVLDLQSLGKRYTNTSLYDYADSLSNKSNLKSVFLKEHYRCHPEIINFSNDQFYEKRLGQSMDVMTRGKDFKFGNPGLNWKSVKGEMAKDKNLNVIEADACIALAKQLLRDNQGASIGVVTPFKDQKKYIFDGLTPELREHIKVDTVHQFQGDEKDIMILSLVISSNSSISKANFLTKNEFLINVALTRAKSSLYIVGDWQYCNSLSSKGTMQSPLQKLAKYSQQLRRQVIEV
ncbi:AAA domain-containing protein [Rufibacter glacialis]|uniref:AAA domain-containing protein n=1 Tax=Rufibacter glacialis TaxID=1259555 RepID=A0A5M8QF92_9BACT|nr:AAA domain-containing protein [Rufibacter glacialis]KAA6434705.1 AAA family ATPase [Rufibacter glacialis]GGK71762.1 hypothetical protein GCM10011405_19970 [Rufibacter glacialis]